MDRAALDAALKHGIECGGWCPAGRLDELGRIPERYPLKEIKEGRSPDRPGGLETAAPWEMRRHSFRARTLQNVKDSDGTVIIYSGELRGGTKQTVRFCLDEKRPHQLIDATKISSERATKVITDFVREKNIHTLNVAGPRQSEWPQGYDYTLSVLDGFFSCRRDVLPHVQTSRKSMAAHGDAQKRVPPSEQATRSVAPLPDRGARQSRRESKRQKSK